MGRHPEMQPPRPTPTSGQGSRSPMQAETSPSGPLAPGLEDASNNSPSPKPKESPGVSALPSPETSPKKSEHSRTSSPRRAKAGSPKRSAPKPSPKPSPSPKSPSSPAKRPGSRQRKARPQPSPSASAPPAAPPQPSAPPSKKPAVQTLGATSSTIEPSPKAGASMTYLDETALSMEMQLQANGTASLTQLPSSTWRGHSRGEEHEMFLTHLSKHQSMPLITFLPRRSGDLWPTNSNPAQQAVSYLKSEFQLPSKLLVSLFAEMERRKLKLRRDHFVVAMEHVGFAEPSEILELLGQMARLSLDGGDIALGRAIVSCTTAKRWSCAVELLQHAKMSRVRIPASHFDSGTLVCQQLGETKLMLELVAARSRQGGPVLDETAFRAWHAAIELSAELVQAACQPDDVEYGKVAKLVSPTPAEILAAVVLEDFNLDLAKTETDAAAAKQIIKRMKSTKVPPNALSYERALDACARRDEWSAGSDFLTGMHARQISLPASYWQNRQRMSCHILEKKCSLVSDVLPVFILLQACGVSLTSYHYIVGLRHVSDDVIKTRAFLKQMRDMAVNPSSYSLFQGFSACSTAHSWHAACEFLRAMVERGLLRSDEVDYDRENLVQLVRSRRDRLELLSDMFSKAGLWEEALRWFAGLSRLGVLPKQADFVDVITALSSSRQWQLASNFLRDVPDRVFTEAMVADLVDRTDDWRILLELLARLKPTGPSSDAIYTATIATCGRASEWERAISLLGESASEAIYGAAINACDKGGEQLRAMQLMDEMCRKKLAPGEVAFSGVLAACRRRAALGSCAAGSAWRRALCLVEDMSASSVPPNQICYNQLLDAVVREPVSFPIFRKGMEANVWPGILTEDDTLDVHSFSAGAAAIAVLWWLAEVVPSFTNGSRGPLKIITGYGKSRKDWSFSNAKEQGVQDRVLQVLQHVGIPPGTYPPKDEARTSKYQAPRQVSFGFGRRFSRWPQNADKKPGPGAHSVANFERFKYAEPTGRSFSRAPRGRPNPVRQTGPGPGAYGTKFGSTEEGPSVTMVGKFRKRGVLNYDEPGPGAYDPSTVLCQPAAAAVGFATALREDFYPKEDKQKPAPGAYHDGFLNNPIGSDCLAFSITGKRRKHDLTRHLYAEPGPGFYKHAHSFGYSTTWVKPQAQNQQPNPTASAL
eukprot:s2783_g2.t1